METSLLAPLIMAFVEAFKQAGVPAKFAPIVALGVGVLFAFALNQDLMQGIIAGFTAVGLWSGGRSTLQLIRR